MIHTVKGFSVVNEAEVEVFLEFLCFSYDPTDVGSLISYDLECHKQKHRETQQNGKWTY